MNMVYSALVPIVASAMAYGVYRLAVYAYGVVLYKLTVTLSITSDDALVWKYLQTFLLRHVENEARDWIIGDTDTTLIAGFVPTPITVMVEGKRVRIKITETPPSQMTLINDYQVKPARRTATLWARHVDASFFRRFLAHIKLEYLTLTKDKVEFALPKVNMEQGVAFWWSQKTIQRRKFSSLTLEPELEEALLKDLKYFSEQRTRAFYRQHDMPYRRGWLFHGPPGNGKSSAIVAAASLLGSNVHRISLQGLDDTALSKLMAGAPDDDPPALLLFEDVDCLFAGRDQENKTSVTFSGLLNALDGVGSPENAIVIMTTNHLEKLDPALIRPGRIDKTFYFRTPDDTRIASHYMKFFPGAQRFDEATLAFVARCRAEKGKDCSMAAVQAAVLEELARNLG